MNAVESLINDLCSVHTRDACDAIIAYLQLPDCSPSCRKAMLDKLHKMNLKEKAVLTGAKLTKLDPNDNILTPKRKYI